MLVKVKDGMNVFRHGTRRRQGEVFEWGEGKLSQCVEPLMPNNAETVVADQKRVKALADALGGLKADNAEAWCAAPPGLVRLDYVMKLTGLERVTREEVNAVAPGLNRETAPKGQAAF